MSEREINLRPVRVEYICDECGEGKMQVPEQNDGTIMAGHGGWYTHFCDNCDTRKNFQKTYPHIKFLEVLLDEERNRHDKWHTEIRLSSSDSIHLGPSTGEQ